MNAEKWREAAALAVEQHGLVAHDQLVRMGWRTGAIKWAVRNGRLAPIRRGVYAVLGSPSTPWRELMAAMLAVGPGAVASHRAAAGLHGLPGVLPGAVEMTVFWERPRRLEGVRCHQAQVIALDDFTAVGGFDCTSVARTLVDVSGTPDVGPRLLATMLDHCLDRRMCTVEDVGACLDRIGGRGRPGTARLQALLAHRREGESPLERTWLMRLRRAGLPAPVVGYQLVVGKRVLIFDLAWPEHRVALEVDGWSAHRSRGRFDSDRERDLVATRAGWRVLRVTSRTPVTELIATLRPFISRESAS